jgi:hypothetical protein
VTEKSSLNDRILSRRTIAPDEDADSADDCGAFGYLRGVRDRALMLELRLKSGNRDAYPYSLLEKLSYDPSEGVTLQFANGKVKLVGRHLASTQANGAMLFEALTRHRVPWVLEGDELRSPAATGTAPVITAIQRLGTK